MVAMGQVVLVLGGTRSGKSAVAERLAAGAAPPVTYLATGAVPDDADPEWRDRVAAHRRRRPPDWDTVELGPGGDLGAALGALAGTVLVDSLGTWLAGTDFARGAVEPTASLCAALGSRRDAGLATVLVSEEVGLGVHPPTEVGRHFADALGDVNQAVASLGGQVLLVVAGRILELAP